MKKKIKAEKKSLSQKLAEEVTKNPSVQKMCKGGKKK